MPSALEAPRDPVLARLQAGTPYWQLGGLTVMVRHADARVMELALGGKRLCFENRALISIPVGWRYRLLCQADESGLHPLSLLTHESYNAAHNRRTK